MAATAALSVTALFFSLGGAGWAANGGAFILGIINSATQRTALIANFNGSTLQVNNTSATALAVPLQLTAAAGHPPMKVNTATKVANLNADYVDGIDGATQLARVMRVPFNLAQTATSAPITVPANVPVSVIGTTSNSANPASGFTSVDNITLRRVPGLFLVWRDSGGTLHSTNAAGISMMTLDSTFQGPVVETAGPDAIRIHNTSSSTQIGTVTLMW
jgi:hypothetical protein